MKDTETRQRFVELRAAGNSYAEIAAQIGICKQTAINWSKDLQNEIGNFRTISLDALQRRYKLHQEARLEMFGGLLESLKSELSKRDLSTLPTDKLLEQILKVSGTVAREKVELVFKKEVSRGVTELMQSLSVGTDQWSA